MGTGSSRPRQVNRRTQVPSATRARTRTPSPPVIIRPTSHTRRPFSSQPSPWPSRTNIQRAASNSTLAHYASVWERNGKLSSTFQQLIGSGSIKVEHNQKEVNNHQIVTKHTSTYETAQVESTLTSEIESIHNLSTSERLDTLILNLKQTHLEFDQSVQRRIGQITSETESILAQIVEETQLSQQELLIHAKEQQTIQDEQYRLLLEQFIAQLDEKRVKQLAFIQEQLQEQRLFIFNESQLKIRALSEQVNSVKNHIMSEEERKASEKIDLIVTEINSISTESAIQHIGTEIKSNFNLTVHEVVGSEQTLFNSEHQHSYKQQNIKRTTYVANDMTTDTRPSSTRFSDQQTKSINKLVKQNPANPKTKSQQPQ